MPSASVIACRLLVAALGALALSACSVGPTDPAEVAPAGPGIGSDGEAADESDSANPAAADSPADQPEDDARSPAGGGATGEPETIEQLEAYWAANRAQVVDSIDRAGYGVGDDNVLRGPGGFELDLNSCPAGWDDAAGTDGGITIAKVAPQTGELWAYGLIADGLGIYFDHINSTGGIDGRNVELLVIDDGYDRTRTSTAVDELLGAEQPFAVTTFGGPPSLEVTERLNEQCVPQPFVISNHPAWGNPVNRPWTTGMQLAYNTEALLWGQWIKQNLGGSLPVTVGALVVDSPFGALYADSFARWAEQNPDVVAEFVPVRHPERAASVSAEMTEVAATEPDVFIAMTNESPCLLAVLASAEVGLAEADTFRFVSSVCRDPGLYLVPAGDAADGVLSLGGGWKTPNDPAHVDDIYMGWATATLVQAQADTAIGFFSTGFAYYGWAHVEALRIAAELDGGLTRSNFILAQRAMSLDHPALLPGIAFEMNGATDGYLIEGSEVERFDGSEGKWEPDGPILDLNGLTPVCVWQNDACTP
jgi:branched-chain amino acid transport system substrate-binding protein